ncbi:MAG: dienelactone hydrolase family protein [Bacteroidota bacterium]|jgi:pimeloyl-ACP methyl ester carboxylesterase
MNDTFKSYISIPSGKVKLEGDLVIPFEAKGLIVFAHGSGSSRFSSRNKMVAEKLQHNLYATLLFDLLTSEENEKYEKRFEISLLTNRLIDVTNWLTKQELTSKLPIGYFGASTGAAAALRAAAEDPNNIKAVVSRGGRPDLAADTLDIVFCPVLLIVGSMDTDVITLNQMALKKIASDEKELKIISGANHLFEEPGKLEKVSEMAVNWFDQYVRDKVLV